MATKYVIRPATQNPEGISNPNMNGTNPQVLNVSGGGGGADPKGPASRRSRGRSLFNGERRFSIRLGLFRFSGVLQFSSSRSMNGL